MVTCDIDQSPEPTEEEETQDLSIVSKTIREVWAHNVYEEFKNIRSLLALPENYCYVAMDTEFPGCVVKAEFPEANFNSNSNSVSPNNSFHVYRTIRENVDMLRLIQLGLTFMDKDGNTPSGISTWQFNFKFSLSQEPFAEDSIELLIDSGIDFARLETDGIVHDVFSELFITSGLILLPDKKITWLSFHSCYDFAYLLKLLRGKDLPEEEDRFFGLLKIYFPGLFDIKYLMLCNNMKGGLARLAAAFKVRRIGTSHQAGSDSLLTGKTFFKLVEHLEIHKIDYTDFPGHLFGLEFNYNTAEDIDIVKALYD